MTGDMAMSGSMDMRDDLGVDGTIDTSLKTDDRPSPLSQVVVRSDSGNGGRIATVDADGLLLNRNIGGFGSMGENPVALFVANPQGSPPPRDIPKPSTPQRTNQSSIKVRPAGLEPATLGLEIPCSIQLSYGRMTER